MKLHYTRQAIADLRSIADYIRDRNPSAARDVEQAIRSTIDVLIHFPKIGIERPELAVRALEVPRFAYTVYYRVERADIWIIHIRDNRRRPLEPGDM